MENEEKCYKLLDELGIEYSYVKYSKEDKENHELVDELIGVKGIKNLLFKTRNLKKELFFVILPREKRFDTKAFRNRFGITKIEMVDDTELKECICTINRLYDKCNDDRISYDTDANTEYYTREAIEYVPRKELLLLNRRLEYVKGTDEELKVKHQIEIVEDIVKQIEDILN